MIEVVEVLVRGSAPLNYILPQLVTPHTQQKISAKNAEKM